MTSERATSFWTELQRALKHVGYLRQPPATRRRRTGEMRVTITERRAMQAFHLLQGESYAALARRFRRDRHHLPRWIWDADYRAFHAYYWGTSDGHAVVERRGRKVIGADVAGPDA